MQMTSSIAVPTHDEAIVATRSWIEQIVIGLNLCPFAKIVYDKDQIRYVVSAAKTSIELLDDLERELRMLAKAAPEKVDTALLIHPQVLIEFLDYNDFLDVADEAVERIGLAGVIQIASFHPEYQFAGTALDDVTNYTNRSPYPMLHLLREASIDLAVAAFPETREIYEKNLQTMRRVGVGGLAALGLGGPGKRKPSP
jgi:hypothetical protein